MGKKCSMVGCRSGYARYGDGNKFKNVFSFPDNPDLNTRWIQFVNHAQWKPTEHSGICIDHFEEQFLKRGIRVTLNYKMYPVSTIIINHEILSKPSL